MENLNLPVSVVIPCYNRAKQTRMLLESFIEANFRCEIIIIDDCSNENIYDLVTELSCLDIRYYRNKMKMGPAYSRNKGIDISTHAYVAFTDNDCLVTENWLIKLHEYISNAKSNVAGVGGRVIGKSNDIISQYFTYHKILDPWYDEGRYLYLVTANAIFKKDLVLKVGGFDVDIKQAGGEDPGLCFKLANEGYQFLYQPEAIIFHDYSKKMGDFYTTFYRYGYGCRKQVDKHYKKISTKQKNNFGGLEID
jgi:GT2 family glycosyltransferase